MRYKISKNKKIVVSFDSSGELNGLMGYFK